MAGTELSLGSVALAAAACAVAWSDGEVPMNGGSPRATRSMSTVTNSCWGTVRTRQLEGSSIGPTPSSARAALMASRYPCSVWARNSVGLGVMLAGGLAAGLAPRAATGVATRQTPAVTVATARADSPVRKRTRLDRLRIHSSLCSLRAVGKRRLHSAPGCRPIRRSG